jgi:ATP-binding cassette, subfamily B, bacterial
VKSNKIQHPLFSQLGHVGQINQEQPTLKPILASELAKFLSLVDAVPRWRLWATLCLLLMFAEVGFGLAIPWLAGNLAAGVLTEGHLSNPYLVLMLVMVLTIQAGLHYLSQWRSAALAHHILAALRRRVYDHLQALPLPTWQQRSRGDMLALLTNDIERLADYLNASLLGLLPAVLAVMGSLFLMFHIDPRLALAACALLPLSYGVLKWVSRGLRPLAAEMQAAQARQVAVADENFELLPLIKAHVRERHESHKFSTLTSEVLRLGLRQSSIYAALSPAVRWLSAISMVLLLVALGGAGQSRTAADMIAFMLYVALLTRPLGELADFYGQTRQALGAMERMTQVMNLPTESMLTNDHNKTEIQASSVAIDAPEILFDHIGFSYPERPPVFSDFHLQIKAGECVALTGANGCGKSTLVCLLLRLMPVQSGQIRLNGQDIAEMDLQSVRSQIAVVSQRVLLANASVLENIAWGSPEASRQDVEEATRRAQAHDFVTALPLGYETVIGDQGVRLSGGQRQKVAMARALLSNAGILVLDEATAMWDEASEAELVAQCQTAFRGRTVIIITHRPALLAMADRVVQL